MNYSMASTIILTLFMLTTNVYAQNDVKNSADHPLITRFPDTKIVSYNTSEFKKFFIAIDPLTDENFGKNGLSSLPPLNRYEGKTTVITYQADDSSTSALAIYRNFEKAFKNNKFKTIFACNGDTECGKRFVQQLYWYGDTSRQGQNPGLDAPSINSSKYDYYYWSGKAASEDTEYIVSLLVNQDVKGTYPATIVLDINIAQELDDNRVSINLDTLEDGITTDGKVILEGVYFEFDKSVLSPESDQTLSIIANYLKANENLKFYVVGHSDSKGALEYNQLLSKTRAEAVMKALVSSYSIESERLIAFGIGPISPMSSNSSKNGRAQNRRVELVLRD